jgi:hypothetical protein
MIICQLGSCQEQIGKYKNIFSLLFVDRSLVFSLKILTNFGKNIKIEIRKQTLLFSKNFF